MLRGEAALQKHTQGEAEGRLVESLRIEQVDHITFRSSDLAQSRPSLAVEIHTKLSVLGLEIHTLYALTWAWGGE